MGFLTGAYLKTSSARMRLQLQNELTSIMSKMQRVQKQSQMMERNIAMQHRNTNSALQYQFQGAMSQLGQQYNIFSPDGSIFSGQQDPSRMEAMQRYQYAQSQMQMEYSQSKAMWDNQFDMIKEAQLQPLKDMEEELAVRKANIESRLRLIEGQEEAAKKMEQASQKDFVPEYTGQ